MNENVTNNNGSALSTPLMDAYTHPLKKAERKIIGRNEEIKKVLAGLMRPELCNVMLLGEPGAGKGHPLNDIIPVADDRGYVKFRDLKVGDLVFDENGFPTCVTGIFPQGQKEVYRVTFKDGTSVLCNDEHLWNVRTVNEHYKNKPFRTWSLRDMIDSKYGVSNGNKACWFVPKNKPVLRKEKDLPIHPYVIGVLIGDGCLTLPDLTISSNDEPVVQRVVELLGASGYHRHKGTYSWIIESSDPDYKNIRTHQMHDLLGDNDTIFGRTSLEKRIPRIYLEASYEQRLELLRGLMDTDGSVSSDKRLRCRFHTSSEGLRDDVMELLWSLGIRNTKSSRFRNDEIHKNEEFSISLKLDDDEKKNVFWLQRHKDTIDKYMRHDRICHRHYDDIGIDTIEDLGYTTEMVCIMVNGESHLYQVGKEHIVTHNTALVQAVMTIDTSSDYIEVDLSKMIADCQTDVNEMAAKLKTLFDEVEMVINRGGRNVVLFIDEFHQIVQLSPAAVEALKPLLADSGTRGIKVIAATTYREFREYISANQPLVERLQRINVAEPSEDVVISILRDMAKRYGVENQFKDDELFKLIYDLTNQYIPANAQPRKSILILDAMIGWHRAFNKPLDKKLLEEVFMQAENVSVSTQVDAANIAETLKKRVLAQEFAVSAIEQRLHIAIADMGDDTKPKASFLFTGSTGVGKATPNDTIIPVYDESGKTHHKLNGDLQVGDYVFNREGKPVKITGVYPQGNREAYEVVFDMGKSSRSLICNDEHLWTWARTTGDGKKRWRTTTLREIIDDATKRGSLDVCIPMNQPVEYPEMKYDVDPYVIGALIGDGNLTCRQLRLCTDDEFIAKKVANLIHAEGFVRYDDEKSEYHFYTGEIAANNRKALFQTADVIGQFDEIYNKLSHEKRIPEQYMYGSVTQRMALVNGLFDTDGSVQKGVNRHRYQMSYSTTSKGLANDVQMLLLSLGIQSSIVNGTGEREHDLYFVYIKIEHSRKPEFFTLPRKLDIAIEAAEHEKTLKRVRKYDFVKIREIKKLNKKVPMTCIMVDDEEHLYQAGPYVVTHNTEMTKQMAKLLFNDERRLIRFDMTEFANPSSMERFRRELTSQIWTRPYSIVLLDEIEKACAEVTRLLLSVLDDGRLLDENNREVTFNNAYIILTTNAASEIYQNIAQYNASDTGDGAVMRKYDALIRRSIISATGNNKFPPELLGRIDCIVPFQPLSEKTQCDITRMRLESVKKRLLDKHGVKMTYTEDVITYLVKDTLTTDSNSGGARAIMNKLNTEVVSAISEYINKHPEATRVGVAIGGEMAAEDKYRLESAAYVKVGPI